MERYYVFPKEYRYTPISDIDAPIMPLGGMAGFLLGTPIARLEPWLVQCEHFKNEEGLTFAMASPIAAFYSLRQGMINFTVYIPSGKIERIGVGLGYRGKLNERIGIGSMFHELTQIDPSLKREGESVFSTKFPGLTIELPPEYEMIDTQVPKKLPDFKIFEIALVNTIIS